MFLSMGIINSAPLYSSFTLTDSLDRLPFQMQAFSGFLGVRYLSKNGFQNLFSQLMTLVLKICEPKTLCIVTKITPFTLKIPDPNMQHSSSMILLDEDSSWDGDSRLVVNWSEVLVSTGQESLPLKVEELAPEIKKEYLAWVYDLGQSNINGKTLASQLRINENFSAWWMTLVEEKSMV